MCLLTDSIKKGDRIPKRIREKDLWYKVFTKHGDRFGGLYMNQAYMPKYELGKRYHYRDGVPDHHHFYNLTGIKNPATYSREYRKGFHLYTSLESAVRNVTLMRSGRGQSLVVAIVDVEDIIAFGNANIKRDWRPETGVFQYITIKKEIDEDLINDFTEILHNIPSMESRKRPVLRNRSSFQASRKSPGDGKVSKPLGFHI